MRDVLRYILNYGGKLINERLVKLLTNHERRITALEKGSVLFEEIRVTVKDKEGNPIPDAIVSLEDGTILKTKGE